MALIQIYITPIIFISFLVIRFIIPYFFLFDISEVFCSNDTPHMLNTSPISEENINSYPGEKSQGAQGPEEPQGPKKPNYLDIDNPVIETDTDKLAKFLEPYEGKRLSDTGIEFKYYVYDKNIKYYNKVTMYIEEKHSQHNWFRMKTDTRITGDLINNIKNLKENMEPWRHRA